jgi:hypothetical protein
MGICVKLNNIILLLHQQKSEYSCIPMAVELVLKFIDKLQPEEFPIQTLWGNKNNGSFSDFDRRVIESVKFKHLFGNARGDSFPMQELFECIDHELKEERYVIVSLSNDQGGWHMFVIYAKDFKNDEYLAVSKNNHEDLYLSNVKFRIKQMKGTDILTYSIV